LSDVAREIGRYAERTEADPGRLAEVEDRLYRLEGLLRQHGPEIEDVLAARERITAELAALASMESRVAEPEQKRATLLAEGGELSRALLALKRSLAECGPAGLYVFDEVDTGVGGAVADKLGRAIADVARHHQVLCITHLAPIAAFADAHFVVEKSNEGGIAT